jgi:hypothetical protein
MTTGAAGQGMSVYEIRVRGALPAGGLDWCEGLTVAPGAAPGEVVLTAPLADQAALHGLLNWLFSLNLTLLELRRREG